MAWIEPGVKYQHVVTILHPVVTMSPPDCHIVIRSYWAPNIGLWHVIRSYWAPNITLWQSDSIPWQHDDSMTTAWRQPCDSMTTACWQQCDGSSTATCNILMLYFFAPHAALFTAAFVPSAHSGVHCLDKAPLARETFALRNVCLAHEGLRIKVTV